MKRILPAGVFRAYLSQRVSAERDAEGRVWCPLFPVGEWHRRDFPDGKLNLTPEIFAEFVANWKAEGSPALPVDYEHVEDDIASGWIEDLRIVATGLEGAIRWTEPAANEIKADQRRYISPTWAMQHVNRRTGEKAGPWLYGAALTNSPFFDSMPRVAATAIAESTQPTNKEKSMLPELKKRCIAALKLPEETSDEEMCAAIEAACKSHASAGEETGKLTASLTAATENTTKLQARVAELEASEAKHFEAEKAHKAELFERDFAAAYDAELAAGRQGLPDLKDTLKATATTQGLDVAKKLMAALPKVKLEASGVAGDDKPGSDLQKFEAAVEAKVKAGMKWTEASKAVAAEMPELSKKLFSNSTRA